MNIFVTHPLPQRSALWLDDRRANQLVRESGQMLSTAIRHITVEPPAGLYESFNPNHPCCVWVRSSPARFQWLQAHMFYLLQRVPKNKHERAREVLRVVEGWFRENSYRFPKDGLLPFQNSAANKEKGVDFKYMTDTVAAYRTYLNVRWSTDKFEPTWKTGEQPGWFRDLRPNY